MGSKHDTVEERGTEDQGRDYTTMGLGFQRGFILFISTIAIFLVLHLKHGNHEAPVKFECPNIPSKFVKTSYDPNHGRLDKSRKFKSHMFAVSGLEWNQAVSSVCLATQLSLDRLHQVPDLLSSWQGPVSFSLLLPNSDISVLLNYIQYLTVCHGDIVNRSTFHVSYPRHEKPPSTPSIILTRENLKAECSDPSNFLNKLLTKNSNRNEDQIVNQETFRYPQNLLRNVAKHGCQTNHSIVSDVDMVPGYPTMFSDLENFVKKKPPCEKCVFVLPVYEISNKTMSLPNGKKNSEIS